MGQLKIHQFVHYRSPLPSHGAPELWKFNLLSVLFLPWGCYPCIRRIVCVVFCSGINLSTYRRRYTVLCKYFIYFTYDIILYSCYDNRIITEFIFYIYLVCNKHWGLLITGWSQSQRPVVSHFEVVPIHVKHYQANVLIKLKQLFIC